MTYVGVDLGTGGVRVAVLDERLELAARVDAAVPGGRRVEGGGHLLDEGAIVAAAQRAVADAIASGPGRRPPAAVAVAGTAGTLCFRNRTEGRAGDAVAYDDGRHGTGAARVEAWARLTPDAVRVLPIADAVLEAFGAERGGTDWTNALRLGWDPASLAWQLEEPRPGFLPVPVPPGAPAGLAWAPAEIAGALLVRGATDGCAMQVACGPLAEGGWAVSLGTTVAWKAVTAAPRRLPPGAYSHRLRPDLWLPGGASNSGGGVLTALQPGGDLAGLDAVATIPSGHAAYPLARPGERFPVADPSFAGFGLPIETGAVLHAAILEGVAFVIRLGVERLVEAGVPAPATLRLTGGGARSTVWPRLIATVTGLPVTAAPAADADLGAALIAAAAATGAPVGSLAPGAAAAGPVSTVEPDPALAPPLDAAYRAFVARLASGSR